MSLDFLKKIAVKLEKKQNSLFTYPIEKQKKYVAHFPEPKDGVERGYYQYCCQMKLYGKPIHCLLNIMAFPTSLLYINKFKGRSILKMSTADAVFFHGGKPSNIIPIPLSERFKRIELCDASENSITKQDIGFLKTIFKRYPLSWMFWLKCILKVSQYSSAIEKYSPKVIISCDEFSFTSSVLTEYCHLYNMKLINVMHGEKLFFMRDAFIKYDEFYVWNKEYVGLFASLRADLQQFRVEPPSSLFIKATSNVNKVFDYTYYLEAEDKEALNIIKQKLDLLEKKGCKVSIRPHPRYSNMKLVNKVLGDFYIEDTEIISIEQSILQTKNVIAAYSSVLNQAYHSGLQIIIDDISRPWLYDKLKELDYMMLKTKPLLLSEI